MVEVMSSVIAENVGTLTDRAMDNINRKQPVFGSDWSPTENLRHNLNLLQLLGQLRESLLTASEEVFITPYHPAVSVDQVTAADKCKEALVRLAVDRVDKLSKVGVAGVIVDAACDKIAKFLEVGDNIVSVEEMFALVKEKLIKSIAGKEARQFCLEQITLFSCRYFVPCLPSTASKR